MCDYQAFEDYREISEADLPVDSFLSMGCNQLKSIVFNTFR